MRWPRRKRRNIARIAQFCFLTAGLILLSYVAYVYASGFVYQTYRNWAFDRAMADIPRQAPAASSLVAPIERIEIPRLGIADMVKEGDDDTTLSLAVGHIPSTALPGTPGNIGLAAHRDTLFRKLKDIRVGDQITLTTLEGRYVYRVAWFKIVPPTEVSVLAPSGDREDLTLVTCYPFYFIGHAPERFIVRAQRQLDQPTT